MIAKTTACGCVLAAVLCGGCRNTAPAAARTSAAELRESAYRANNRGVALMERSSYGEAIAAFRDALTTDPALRLARINLAIGLFYAGQPQDAAREAEEARRDYPEAPQPLYLLGLIARGENRPDAARDAFVRVLTLDPADAGAKLNLAMVHLEQARYAEAAALCRSVLADEPYNVTAAYNLALALNRDGDARGGAVAMRRFEQLRNAPYAVTLSQNYLEQGRYAEAIASTGVEPDLVNASPPRVAFVDATDAIGIGSTNRRAADAMPPVPLAGGVTLADIDADGDLDVLASGPALTVWRNDRGHLVDATAGMGFSGMPADVTGAIAGDVNNDDRADVIALTMTGPRLFLQDMPGRFSDRTPASFAAAGPARAAALVDVDHDGDLDLFVGALAGGANHLFRNNGNGTWVDVARTAGVARSSAVVAVAPTDFDNRRDVDLLTIRHGAAPQVFRNLRNGTFQDVARDVMFAGAADFTSAAGGDVNKDGFIDFFLARESGPGSWIVSDGRGRFRAAVPLAGSDAANAAQVFDYDNDGLQDLVIVSASGPHLFRNTGRAWSDQTAVFSAGIRQPPPPGGIVTSLATGDLDLDGDTDIVAHLQDGGIRVWRNDGGSAQKALRVALTGRPSNHGGVGAKIEVRAGSLYGRIETSSSTPAMAPADALFGLGSRTAADAVRVLWPSGIVQTETPSSTSDQRIAIVELDRKPSSCPFLYTWDGGQFTFVTDFMGGGEMGYLESPGVHNVPDPDEYVRISDQQLRERGGRYELRVTNELEEVLFVDHLQLLAVTHPADVEVFPDEGMRVRPAPFSLYAVRGLRPLASAVDDSGRDLLPDLAAVDRRYAAGFPLEPIRGYAKPHALTMRLPAHATISGHRTVLVLTGWTDYAFSTDNVAAAQAGLTLPPPVLQVRSASGEWNTVNADVGVPIGRPQTLVLDVTDYATQPLRLLTSMRIYWDRIAVGDVVPSATQTTVLPMLTSSLRWRGFSAETSPDGREPYGYDYRRVSAENPWKVMPGRYTREGDVGELLGARDDRFVISRPGDEIVLSFDAARLGPVPGGMRRTFLLYSVGYSKEMDLYSASPDVVPPIPFGAMSRYPYTWPVQYPHTADLERFHTRVVRRSIPALDAGATEH